MQERLTALAELALAREPAAQLVLTRLLMHDLAMHDLAIPEYHIQSSQHLIYCKCVDNPRP